MPFPRIQWFTNKATYSNTLNLYDFALHVSLLVPGCFIIFLIILICVTRPALCFFPACGRFQYAHIENEGLEI